MRILSKAEYKGLYLYAKGLTFTESSKVLGINSKSAYAKALIKDNPRLKRAKTSRLINKKNYKDDLVTYTIEVKQRCNGMHISNVKMQIQIYRYEYILKALNGATSSYNRYRLTFIKNKLTK